MVGMPRIELGLYAPEAYVIPLYHGPVGLPGVGPGLYPPHGHVLPVYYSPLQVTLAYSLWAIQDSNL